MDKPKKVVLCGSTRFKAEFIQANYRETMQGKIVLSVGWFSHADKHIYQPTEAEKAMLDELHLRKIDEADEVLVLNVLTDVCAACRQPVKKQLSRWQRLTLPLWRAWVRLAIGGVFERTACCHAPVITLPYIGESTAREVAYAVKTGKPVRYLHAGQA